MLQLLSNAFIVLESKNNILMHNIVDFFRCYNEYFAISIGLFLLGLHARARSTVVFITRPILSKRFYQN